MHDLTIDRVLTPLVCYFIDCKPVWLSETRRQLNSRRERFPGQFAGSAEIRWETRQTRPDLSDEISPHSLAVMGVEPAEIETRLRLIHSLYLKNVTVAVVGEHSLVQHLLVIRTAGAIAVVTDIFGCDRLASVISKAAKIKLPIMTSWRTRFVNRLPWKPV